MKKVIFIKDNGLICKTTGYPKGGYILVLLKKLLKIKDNDEILNNIDLTEKFVEALKGNKLHYKSAKYDFTYRRNDLYITLYGGVKKEISDGLAQLLNIDIYNLRNFEKDIYNCVRLKNKTVYFKQIFYFSRFDYERYYAIEVSKFGRKFTRRVNAEIGEFADLEHYEKEFRDSAKDDEFFLSHIDYYKEQQKNADIKSFDVVASTKISNGEYFIEALCDGKKIKAMWSPGNKDNIVTLKGKTLHLTEIQMKTIARFICAENGLSKGIEYNRQNGYFTLFNGQCKRVSNCYDRVKSRNRSKNIFDFINCEGVAHTKNKSEFKEFDADVIKKYYDTNDGKLKKTGVRLCSEQRTEDRYTVFALEEKSGDKTESVALTDDLSAMSESIKYELNRFGVNIGDLICIRERKSSGKYTVYSSCAQDEKEANSFAVVKGGDIII